MLQKLLVQVCILLFIIINLFASVVQGQSLLYNNYYTQENGLCSSVINQIVKDKKGFLWLTTESGLMRFDGYKFKTYRHYPSIPASLTSSDIRTIGFTDDSDMILRTENSITKYYRKNNTFKSLYTITENYSTIRFEKGFNKGDWWMFKKDSLIRFDIESENIKSYQLPEDQTSIEFNSNNFSKERIIYTSRNKCFCFNILNNKFENINLKPLSNKGESMVYCLAFTHFKNQYLFKDGSIYKWNEKDTVFDFVVDTKIQLTSREQILSHYVTSKYILLALSDLKIIKINIENGRANWIQLDESPKSKLQFALNFFKSSNENEVWLNGGLTKTIYKLSIETNEVSKTIIELPAQFNSEDLYRIQCIFPTDKVIWVAVSGFGLIKYELTNYSFASFKPFVKDEVDRDIWSNNIRTIADWDDENYVVGSLNGTFLFNKKNKKFNEFPIRFTEDVQHILTNGKILNYGNYTLLGGWYTKWLIVINRLNNEYKIIDLTPENKTDYLSIRSLFIDSKKNLWVGTINRKLFKLPFDSVMQNKSYKIEQLINKQNELVPVNHVFAIEENKNSEILLGTQFGFIPTIIKIKNLNYSEIILMM